MNSLRLRVLVAAIGSLLVAAIAAGTTSYILLRHALLAQFDTALLEQARALASAIDPDDDGHRGITYRIPDLPELLREQRPMQCEIRNHRGALLGHSPGWTGPLVPGSDLTSGDQILAGRLAPDRPARIARVDWRIRRDADDARQPAEDLIVLLAKEPIDLDDELVELRLLLLIAGLIAALGATGLVVVALRRALAPLDAIAGAIAGIDARNHRDLRLAGIPRELAPLVERLNELQVRVGQALASERAFSAAAAHELRTPLAALRLACEVAVADAHTAATATASLALVEQMQRIVERLLLLARLDAGQIRLEARPVSIEETLHECWEPHARLAQARGLHLHRAITPGLELRTDPTLLRLVLGNLLGNAVSHCAFKGDIRLHIAAAANGVSLSLANDGCTLATTDLPRVFERFWRGDAARCADGGHSGLGLSLCRDALQRLGGEIRVTLPEPGWFRVEVALPSDPPAG